MHLHAFVQKRESTLKHARFFNFILETLLVISGVGGQILNLSTDLKHGPILI